MRETGLVGAVRGKVKRTRIAGPGSERAADLVRRDFGPVAPNVLWVADIERHEALLNRAVVKGHRFRLVAASRKKLRAAVRREVARCE